MSNTNKLIHCLDTKTYIIIYNDYPKYLKGNFNTVRRAFTIPFENYIQLKTDPAIGRLADHILLQVWKYINYNTGVRHGADN